MIARGMGRETRFGACLLQGALLLNSALALFYVVLWIGLARQGAFWKADFTAYYTAGSIVRDGQSARLYDLGVQQRYQQQILAGRTFADGVLLFVNPPHAAILFTPLAALPLSTAFFVWTGAQVLLLAWLVRRLLRLSAEWTSRERWLLVATVLAFPPLLFTFQLGALSLFMLVCVFETYVSLKRADEVSAGLWLALATLKPQAMLLPILILPAARRWIAAASFALAFAAAVIVSSGLLGWRVWLDFRRLIGVVSQLFDANGIVPAEMYNLKGTLTLLLGNEQRSLINGLSAGALTVAAGAVLVVWLRAARPDDSRFELRVSLTVLLGTLFSLHLYPHDALLLVAPAVLCYSYLRERSPSWRAYVALLATCPLWFALSESFVGEALRIRIPVIAMVAMTTWTARTLYRRYPSTSP
jgi:Glycosyltransferase family 87